jgi:cytochrome c oxidase subunit II
MRAVSGGGIEDMTNRSRRRKLLLAAVGLATLALVVAGCGPSNGQNSLDPKGVEAEKIDNLFWPVMIVAVIIGIFIFLAVLYCAIRFRRRADNERPKQIHGNTALEIGWTLIPAVILAVVAVPTVSLIFQLNEDPAPDALEVTAVGKQWWWQFDYPASKGSTKVVTANEMHVPTGREISIDLTACDQSLPGGCNVIHSFWVPELNGKRDVVPGHNNHTSFTIDKPGTYLGQCAEYCGLSHANMRFRVIAQSPDDFEQWLSEQQDGPAVALEDSGDAGELFSKTFACTNCHTTEDSSISTYGPNLTHFASRTVFASGSYKVNRANLIDWILNAPSMIPMESQDCRLPPGPGVICVGMPSFTENTPKGDPVMTRAQAETLADYLLSLK